MIYVAVAREIWTRIKFHTEKSSTDGEPLLQGLKLVKSGDFRVESAKNLPLATLVDLTGREVAGRAETRVTLFLKTDRKNDWVTLEPNGKQGLLDWLERLMDAVETAPSTGEVDKLLTLHKADGTVILDRNQQPLWVLSDPFTWDFRMSEITDLSFMMELDLVFNVPRGDRGNRANSPVTAASYAA